ncbi:hypothetical protein KAH81_00960 [bacterium]|nr:hypothetical protein [bacterium]
MRNARILLATSFFLACFSVVFAQVDSTELKLELYPPGMSDSRRIISSGEMRLAVNDVDGRFTIGTIDGKSLLFGFPHEGATSHTHFFVNDSVAGTYSVDGGTHPDPARVLLHPIIDADAVVSRYEIDGIQFEQRLTITVIGERSTALIEYIATNTTTLPADVGLLIFFDTMIGDNDYAPIATEYGYFAVEREFITPNIPTYWQAFESSPWQPEDSLIGSGVLVGGSAEPPDRIVFGDFWHYRNTIWDYIVTPDPYSDSAVLMRWDVSALAPGATRRMATYYGLGKVEISIGDLNLSLSGPDELEIESCSFRTPNPFPVNLLVSNATGIGMSDILAEIELPDGFHALDSAVTPVMPDILGPGATGSVSWSIVLDDGYFSNDTTICLEVNVWSPITDTFSVDWCIDIPGIDGRGPSAELVAPSDGSLIACDTLALLVRLSDPSEVDVSTIELDIDGISLSYPDPRFSYSSSFLRCFIPVTDLVEGNVEISLGDIRDLHGCPLVDDYSWNIYLDWHPPIAAFIEPAPDDTVESDDFEVLASLDDLTGIEDTSLFWTLDGVTLDIPINIIAGRVSFQPMETGLLPLGLSEHIVCLDGIHDKVYGYCGPNYSEPICIDFWTNIVRPYAQIIEPYPGSYSSCESQRIVSALINPSGDFDISSITMTVNGVVHHVGDGTLTLDDDTLLIFVPDDSFEDGSMVDVYLTAETSSRTAITPLSWSFGIDLTPPEATLITPISGVFSTVDETIELSFTDDGAGVDFSSIVIDIRGDGEEAVLHVDSPELTIFGSSASFSPADLGIALSGCDTIEVEVAIADRAMYCFPNRLGGSVFAIEVPCTPPICGPCSIAESVYVSCDTLNLSMLISDDEGVDYSAISIFINGIIVDLGSSHAIFEGDTLKLSLPWDDFPGDSMLIIIDGIADIFGNSLGYGLTLFYYKDTEPPTITGPVPEPSSYMTELLSVFSFEVADSSSGVDMARTYVSFGGIRVDRTSGLSYDGALLSAPTSILEPFDSESLRVCVYAFDNSEVCGANSNSNCWTYYFDFNPPEVEFMSPPAGAILGCPNQPFRFRITDDQGIDPSTIILTACGIDFHVDGMELVFDGEILHFYPDSSLFHDNEVCSVFVVSVNDSAGNALSSAVGDNFLFDFSPPICISELMEPFVAGPLQRLKWMLSDLVSGVSTESIIMTINDIEHNIDSPALSFDGSSLVFDPYYALQWTEDIEIDIRFSDNAFACPNNGVFIDTLPYIPSEPDLEINSPSQNAYIACDPLQLSIFVDSDYGLDLSDVTVTCGAISLSEEDIEITAGNITIEFPEGTLTAGHRQVIIDGFIDTLGNVFTAETLGIILDFEAPRIGEPFPYNGQNVSSENLIITTHISDDFAGINLDLLALSLNGVIYYLDSPLMQLLGDSLALDATTLDLSGSIAAEIEAFDKTTNCGPNSSNKEWCFSVNSSGPEFSLIEPIDGSITHVEDQVIKVSIEDPEGLSTVSILLDVDGNQFTLADSMTLTGDILEFRPQTNWSHGDTLDISIYCEDALGNPSSSYLGSFICDFEPPFVVSTSPENNAVLKEPPEYISLNIMDNISGFDQYSFEVEWGPHRFTIADPCIYIDSSSIVIDVRNSDMIIGSPDSLTLKYSNISDYEGDYGSANVMETFSLNFTVVDEGCLSLPRPFTPNADGYYDEVTIFTGLSKTAIINVFTIDGRLVRSTEADGKWNWDGKDNNGMLMSVGTYLFTVSSADDGSTKCGGTVVLAR